MWARAFSAVPVVKGGTGTSRITSRRAAAKQAHNAGWCGGQHDDLVEGSVWLDPCRDAISSLGSAELRRSRSDRQLPARTCPVRDGGGEHAACLVADFNAHAYGEFLVPVEFDVVDLGAAGGQFGGTDGGRDQKLRDR